MNLQRLFRSAGWLTALVLAACEGDAGSSGSDAGSSDASADVGNGIPQPKRRLFVFDTVTFTRQNPVGVAPGFDLDGKVSAQGDPAGCGHADFTSPDGKSGIDNNFALLVPLIELTEIQAFEKLLQSSIESGGVLLMAQLDGVDDLRNDPEVTVMLRAGQGLPLLGTDGKLLSGQTFHVNDRDPATVAGKGAIQDGWIEVGPFDLELPVQVFGVDYTLSMRKGRLRFHILDDERIDGGVVGGGITLDSIYALAKKAAQGQGDIDEIVGNLVAGMGDMAPDSKGACTQISAALAFQGVSAFFYPDEVTPTRNGP
jgi:hypothetical protein